MFPFYRDYFWKGGKPFGVQKVDPLTADQRVFRIVSDPYHKWISIETYLGEAFDAIIYDSRFLDFRKLKPTEQIAWRKKSVGEAAAWIFNEDDRVILKEVCCYKEGLCREVKIYSPYQTLICRYVMVDGPLGSLLLYDSQSRPVMSRGADHKENWDPRS